MTRVKICGITNLSDAADAADAGADAVGLNFCVRSPRYIDPPAAASIRRQVPASVGVVAVFVNADLAETEKVCSIVGPAFIQLHGDESPDYVREIRRRSGCKIIKAFRIHAGFDSAIISDYEVDAVLLDGFSPLAYGGTGKIFDWTIAGSICENFSKVFMAGGLSSENVVSAIKTLRPYAVDVCSSVESSPGQKCKEKMQRFVAAAKGND